MKNKPIRDGERIMTEPCVNGHMSVRIKHGHCRACIKNQQNRSRAGKKTDKELKASNRIEDIQLAKELGISLDDFI